MAWDENKKYSVTFDHTKVDADLEGFPFVAALDGTNHPELFQELVIDPDDSFTGPDGDPPEPDRWSLVGSPDIQSNKCRLTTASGEERITSRFLLRGDFDIQIDFDLVDYPATEGWNSSLRVRNPTNGYWIIANRKYHTSHYYQCSYFDGTQHHGTVYSTSDITGKLRLARSGSTVTAYKWNGSSWDAMDNAWTGLGTADLYAEYVVTRYTGNPTHTVDVDNFTVTSGSIQYDYRRKRVAFFADGDQLTGRKCHAEIELFDSVNEKAIYHVWAPEILAAGDTELQLYFDASKSDQDTTTLSLSEVFDDFTGDNGDPPDSFKWPDGNGSPDIQSNQLEVTGSGGNYESVRSSYVVRGDFDIQVDFSLDLHPETDRWFVWLDLKTNDGKYHRINRHYRTASGNAYRHTSYDGTNWYAEGETSRDDLTGKLRMTRSGDTFTSYAWYNSQWNQIAQAQYIKFTDDVFVQLGVGTGGSNPTAQAKFDNFTINSADKVVRITEVQGGTEGIQLTAAEASDEFTGSNGDPPDPGKWTIDAGDPEIQGNKLRHSVSSTANAERMLTRFVVQGDFDIQVDFDLITYPASNGYNFAIQARTADDERVSMGTGYDVDHRRYISQEFVTSWSTVQETTTADTSGKLRLVRSGSTLTFYTWNGASWDSRGTSTVLGTDDVSLWLVSATWNNNPTATCDFDNFTINSADYIYKDGPTPQPDPNRWRDILQGNIVGGKLRLKGDSDSQGQVIWRHRLVGDFDVQVDFNLITYPATVGWGTALRVFSHASGYMNQISKRYSGTSHKYESQYYDGSWHSVSSQDSGDTSGKLRIIRNGSTTYFYYWGGSSWTALGSTTGGVGGDDVELRFVQERWNINPTSEADYFNFLVTQANEISGWIGDIGDYPAQEVWDSDFAAVLHMAQDPSGGSGAVKDSTREANHLTMTNMEAADLVDGKVGKALDFDGVDERGSGPSSGFDPTADHTIEAVCDLEDLAVSGSRDVLAQKDGTGTGRSLFGVEKPSNVVFRSWLGGAGRLASTALAADTWYYAGYIYDAAATQLTLFLNDDPDDGSHSSVVGEAADGDFVIGAHKAEASSFWYGAIDEVRVSSIQRSASWRKATYYSFFGTLVTIQVPGTHQQPATPSIVSVTELYSTSCTLNGSAFSDPDGDGHEASQWQVDLQTGDFSSPVKDSGETATYLTNYPVTGLTKETDYKARVRYKDDSGDAGTEWSEWSTPYNFTTKGDWTGIVFSNKDPEDQEKQVQNDREIKCDITDNWYELPEADLKITVEGEQYTNLDPETSYQAITDGKRLTWTPPFNYDYGRGNEVNVRIDAKNSHEDESYTQWSFFGFWHLTIEDGQLSWLFRHLNKVSGELVTFFRQACWHATQTFFKFRYASGIQGQGAAQAQTSIIITVRSLLHGAGEPTVFVCEFKRQFAEGSANVAEAQMITGEASANIYGTYLVLSGGQANIQAYMFFVVPAGSADIAVEYISQAEAAANIGIPTDLTGEGSALIFKKETGAWIRINAIPAQVKQALQEAGVTIDA